MMRFGSLVMRFTNNFVTHENYWQITSLVTQKLVIHGNPCIILYISFSEHHDYWWCGKARNKGVVNFAF